MTQVCLVDSGRLSGLLQEALSWNQTVTSLLVSARNGSIIAYAFRNTTPSIKAMRTRSTTMTAAYSVASEEVLVFEAQNSQALTVIAPIADHVLLAVTGHESTGSDPYEQHVHQAVRPKRTNGTNGLVDNEEEEEEDDDEDDEDRRDQIRSDLVTVNQELASILKEALSGLKWPDDI
jgi:hypothetical protein